MEWIHDLVVPGDTPASWACRRQEIKRRIGVVVGSMPAHKVPLDVQIIEQEEHDTYVVKKIDYAAEPDDRVPAYLVIPKAIEKPVPAILCLHGTSSPGKLVVMGRAEAKPNMAYAVELAERGYVTLAPDIMAIGERIFPGREHLDVAPFLQKFPDRTVMGKNLWDHMRAVDLLQGLPEVEGEKVGAVGHSLGGRNTHYLAALDERIACAVVSAGIIPLSGHYRMFWRRNKYESFGHVAEFVRKHNRLPFEKHEVTSLIAPRPCMVVGASTDVWIRRTDLLSEMAHRVSDVYRLHDAEKNFCRLLHGHGHDSPPHVRRFMYDWFDLHLRYPPEPMNE